MKYFIIVIVPLLLLPIYVSYCCYIGDLLDDKLEHKRQQKKYKRLKVNDVFEFNQELKELKEKNK